MSNEITTSYETYLTESALELFEKFRDALEYGQGYSQEAALQVFAFDLYTSSPTIFKNGNVNAGDIDPTIIDLVEQCSDTDIRKLAKVDRVENSATISEKLMAANSLLEGGNCCCVEDVISFVVNGSNELIVEINAGNISSELIETLGCGDFEYDIDEISTVLEGIATHPEASKICGYIENGTISTRDALDDVIDADMSCAAKARLSR